MIEEELVPFGIIEDGHDPDEYSILATKILGLLP